MSLDKPLRYLLRETTSQGSRLINLNKVSRLIAKPGATYSLLDESTLEPVRKLDVRKLKNNSLQIELPDANQSFVEIVDYYAPTVADPNNALASFDAGTSLSVAPELATAPLSTATTAASPTMLAGPVTAATIAAPLTGFASLAFPTILTAGAVAYAVNDSNDTASAVSETKKLSSNESLALILAFVENDGKIDRDGDGKSGDIRTDLLTVADFAALDLDDFVSDANLEEVNEAFAAADPEDVASVQAIENFLRKTAVLKIAAYAETEDPPVPTAQDYKNAGLWIEKPTPPATSGSPIGASMVGEVNRLLALNANEIDSSAADWIDVFNDMQRLIWDNQDLLEAVSIISAYANSDGVTTAPTKDNFDTAELTLNGEAIAITAIAAVNSVFAATTVGNGRTDLPAGTKTEQQLRINEATARALEKINDYIDDPETSPPPIASDFILAGVTSDVSDLDGNPALSAAEERLLLFIEAISRREGQLFDTPDDLIAFVNALSRPILLEITSPNNPATEITSANPLVVQLRFDQVISLLDPLDPDRPRLKLDNAVPGEDVPTASYTSGLGTNTLVFTYTPSASDGETDSVNVVAFGSLQFLYGSNRFVNAQKVDVSEAAASATNEFDESDFSVNPALGPFTDTLVELNVYTLDYQQVLSKQLPGNALRLSSDEVPLKKGPFIIELVDADPTTFEYIDELTGVQTSLSRGGEPELLRTIGIFSQSEGLAITPLTELATRIALKSGGDIYSHYQSIAESLGHLFAIDSINSQPSFVIDDAFDHTDGITAMERYGQVLAVLSSMDAITGSVGKTIDVFEDLLRYNLEVSGLELDVSGLRQLQALSELAISQYRELNPVGASVAGFLEDFELFHSPALQVVDPLSAEKQVASAPPSVPASDYLNELEEAKVEAILENNIAELNSEPNSGLAVEGPRFDDPGTHLFG
jgi:hypothetical protein